MRVIDQFFFWLGHSISVHPQELQPLQLPQLLAQELLPSFMFLMLFAMIAIKAAAMTAAMIMVGRFMLHLPI